MPRGPMIALVVVIVSGVIAFATWYTREYPREIVGHGSVRVSGPHAGNSFATHATRKVAINGVVFEEVALPNGTWIACNGDCAKAAYEATAGFWEKQSERR